MSAYAVVDLNDLYSSCTSDQSRVSYTVHTLYLGRMDQKHGRPELGETRSGIDDAIRDGGLVMVRRRLILKPICMHSSIGLDRLSTWNEVRCAMDADFSSRACSLPEDILRLAIVSAMSNAISN